MLKEALGSVILPAMDELIKSIAVMAKEYAYVPMLSRTHGQVMLKEKTFTVLPFCYVYLFFKAMVMSLNLSIYLSFFLLNYNAASFAYNFGEGNGDFCCQVK